jgi:hypothetical protein
LSEDENPDEKKSVVISSSEIRLPAYTVENAFTQTRLATLKLVQQICRFDASHEAIASIPRRVWRVLVRWLFQYKHNNFYLAAFTDLFTQLLRAGVPGENRLKFLFDDLKLLSSLIDYYTTPHNAFSLDGYVLQICNHLRLTADMQGADSFITKYLTKHTHWLKFLPVLREKSKLQISAAIPLPKPAHVPVGPQIKSNVDTSIDLGSKFAKDMGYDPEAKQQFSLSNGQPVDSSLVTQSKQHEMHVDNSASNSTTSNSVAQTPNANSKLVKVESS